MQTLKLAKMNNGPEIFYTLQGEGVNTGMPAIFIRASLCNLHCKWCDTDYTWNWHGTPWRHDYDALAGYEKYEKSEWIVEMPVEEIADHILQYDCKNLIMTGGEPLLQQDGWVALLKHLRLQDETFRFEVETNGTQIPNDELAELVDQFNVSPKLANSGNVEEKRITPKALAWFRNRPNCWFKFVVKTKTDLSEVHQLIEENDLPASQIILMPEGRTIAALNKRRGWLAEICKDNGFRFSDRLHVRLWGSKRGT